MNEPASAGESAPLPPAHPPARRLVLVVDDDHDVAGAIRAVLENKGYRVLLAHDGNAGLALAQREVPDVLICDMMMPKKSGFLVVEHLKRINSPSRIVMITANEGSRHMAYAEMLGVDAYLRKPFAMERLVDEVKRLAP